MMGSYGWMSGFGGFGMLLGVVVWLAIIFLLVSGVGSLFGHGTTDTRTDALEIVKRRFAEGEITSGEYEIARRALMGLTGSAHMKGTN